jgi:ABC-type branched-subunit amino acid transport system ATPase component
VNLYVDCQLDTDLPPLRIEASPGTWVTSASRDPDGAARAIAGTGPGAVGILLGGRQLAGLRPSQRWRAGLAVALCRLEPMPTMRVADVLLLGLRAPRPHLWQTIAGTAKARTMMRDDEAQVRGLAGRLGIAEWVDAPAVNLPPEVQAVTDIARALASVPHALLLRRPAWLTVGERGHIEAAIRDEQQRHDFAVVELTGVADEGDRGNPDGATLAGP